MVRRLTRHPQNGTIMQSPEPLPVRGFADTGTVTHQHPQQPVRVDGQPVPPVGGFTTHSTPAPEEGAKRSVREEVEAAYRARGIEVVPFEAMVPRRAVPEWLVYITGNPALKYGIPIVGALIAVALFGATLVTQGPAKDGLTWESRAQAVTDRLNAKYVEEFTVQRTRDPKTQAQAQSITINGLPRPDCQIVDDNDPTVHCLDKVTLTPQTTP